MYIVSDLWYQHGTNTFIIILVTTILLYLWKSFKSNYASPSPSVEWAITSFELFKYSYLNLHI